MPAEMYKKGQFEAVLHSSKGPQSLLESFFGLNCQLQTKFVPYVLTRDGTRPTEMSKTGLFERVLHSSNATR